MLSEAKSRVSGPKSLVIVESPAKAKTINKFLGRNYIVKASMGNIRDLPPKGLAVDIENDFTPQYAIIRGKSKVIKELQTTAKDVDSIYLATDPDREGEAIGWHLAYVLRNLKKPIHRVTFNEITKNAVIEAIKHPTDINQNLVDAQKARRVLDRLVGYQISPILWRNIKGGLSAGRVQSVAVRLICEREAEIEAFVPQEYWSITAKLRGEKTSPFEARLFKIGARKADIQSYGFFINEEDAKAIVEDAKDKQFIVKDVVRKERKRFPVPPFITSTLQQEAAGKLHFPAKKTMLIAQQLYEGLEIGDEGSVGLITYMRTDSTRIADEALTAVRDFIKNTYGKEYLPAEAVHYKSKKGAQDAHEAIRPTYMDKPPEAIKNFLNDDQYKLYDLIWKRFVASQMKPAILDVTTIDISAGKYIFRATGSIIKFKGFMLVYMEGKDESAEDEEAEKEIILPELKVGELLELLGLLPKQHFTQPPPRYSERSLVKELEEKGIGRPSTYAAIISTIQDREYVVKESGRFMPTEIGRMVNQVLIKSFPDILDVQFTATMESTLDNVEDGKADWVGMLREFYTPFSKSLEAAPDTIYNAKKEMEEVSEEVCEKCGKPMIVKWGRYGQFLGCSGYPECKNIKSYHKDETPPEDESKSGTSATHEICDKCGKPMVIKTSRAGGKFLACTGYPECKNAKSISTGVNCPEPDCGGYIGERRSKRGRIFYSCSRYPDCKFALWDKPVPKSCPECGATFLVEKTSKAKGQYLACVNKKCGYTE